MRERLHDWMDLNRMGQEGDMFCATDPRVRELLQRTAGVLKPGAGQEEAMAFAEALRTVERVLAGYIEDEATRLGVYTCDFVRYDETTAHCYNRDNGDLITVSVGDYRSATLQDCWKMWQARAALSAPSAAGVPNGISALASFVAFADALKLNLRDRADLWDGAMALYRQLTATPTPPASEQQRAVVMPAETLANLHSLLTELQWQWEPHDDHWHTPMGHYCPHCRAEKEVGHHQNCAIASMLAEFLRLIPHLAKGDVR